MVWQRWLSLLSKLSEVRIVGCYFGANTTCMNTIELHLFSDASEIAYAASGYLRIVDKDGEISCRTITGKCRNCPIKRPTISRLELLASVLWPLDLKRPTNIQHQNNGVDHVPGALNPADDGSRGLQIEAFHPFVVGGRDKLS